MCENRSFLAAKFTGAAVGGGRTLGITLSARLALRGLRPCVAQDRQQFFFGRYARSNVLLKTLFRRARDSRRGFLPPWPSPGRGGVIDGSFSRAAGVLFGLAG